MKTSLRNTFVSTQECKEMINQDFKKNVNKDQLKQNQEELSEEYEKAIRKDQMKENRIKQKLIEQFFDKHRSKNDKSQFRKKISKGQSINIDIRSRLQKQFKNQLSFSINKRSKSVQTSRKSSRYGDSSPLASSVCYSFVKPVKRTSSIQHSKKTPFNYSAKIDTIIEQSTRLKSRQTGVSRKFLKTTSERKRQQKLTDKNQKMFIIEKIISNDIDDYLRMYSIDADDINPETQRKLYEQRKRKELSNFDKYNMSFVNYVREKTSSNIERSIYNEKIRKKDSFLQKFQKYILDQMKFSDQAHHRLEKIFEKIETQVKGRARSRQLRQRFKPK